MQKLKTTLNYSCQERTKIISKQMYCMIDQQVVNPFYIKFLDPVARFAWLVLDICIGCLPLLFFTWAKFPCKRVIFKGPWLGVSIALGWESTRLFRISLILTHFNEVLLSFSAKLCWHCFLKANKNVASRLGGNFKPMFRSADNHFQIVLNLTKISRRKPFKMGLTYMLIIIRH